MSKKKKIKVTLTNAFGEKMEAVAFVDEDGNITVKPFWLNK